VTKQEVFKPVSVSGNIIDFGQNIAGWVRIRVQGHNGDTIKIQHAESLDNDGKLYTGNLREARAEDIYILRGGLQTLEPHFTYHGFRYAKAEGFTPTKNNCVAVSVHSNLKHTGSFNCSNPLINQLQRNIEWSLNSNFFDIPTDCPQRSERLGWTGDAQMFCRTASFNRNVQNFFSKWLADLASDQGSNGAVPVIIPDIYGHLNTGPKRGIAGWGDAATIIPWTMYDVYADTSVLARQYASMKAWVEYIRSASPDLLWKADGYGDWYAQGASTSLPLIDQCFFAYSTELIVKAATVLQKPDDIEFHSTLLKNIKTVFVNTYKDSLNTQTACILALQFDLLPDSLRPAAVAKLVSLIHQNKDHLSTGFLGTPYLLHVLSRFGHTELAYTILNQTTMPSWLYPITKGATTIWEKWDAIKPDGTFDTCSLNHYAYGAVGDWLYQNVAGIQYAAPGYKKIIIHPLVGGGLSWVKSSYTCTYGKIVSNWKLDDGKLTMHVEIPKGTTAIIYVPGKKPKQVSGGIYELNGIL
jgi:alpha-L-rhamnosidase